MLLRIWFSNWKASDRIWRRLQPTGPMALTMALSGLQNSLPRNIMRWKAPGESSTWGWTCPEAWGYFGRQGTSACFAMHGWAGFIPLIPSSLTRSWQRQRWVSVWTSSLAGDESQRRRSNCAREPALAENHGASSRPTWDASLLPERL